MTLVKKKKSTRRFPFILVSLYFIAWDNLGSEGILEEI